MKMKMLNLKIQTTTMTNQEIKNMINTMTLEELKSSLEGYMLADERYAAHPVGIEVRLRDTMGIGGRYDVVLLMSDGTQREVKFTDRNSRLVYIFTLMHPQGYQRRMLAANDYNKLGALYSMLYYRDSESLLKSIGDDYDHFFSQAVAQSRVALRKACPNANDFVIDRPQNHAGKTLIPFAKNQGTVIIDSSLTA